MACLAPSALFASGSTPIRNVQTRQSPFPRSLTNPHVFYSCMCSVLLGLCYPPSILHVLYILPRPVPFSRFSLSVLSAPLQSPSPRSIPCCPPPLFSQSSRKPSLQCFPSLLTRGVCCHKFFLSSRLFPDPIFLLLGTRTQRSAVFSLAFNY